MRWLVLCALVGCIEASLAPCGDLLCADGSICVADTVCATQAQLDACNGAIDGDSCQSTAGPGYCELGVCVANQCGDGSVTGIEVCDGAEQTLTCASFGYYAGDLACTPSCVADASGCSGRCGDGEVQTQFGEQCDTAPPTDGCLDFGHDYGVLTCNAFCAPAIPNDCSRYGFEQLLPATSTYIGAAANAHGVIGLTATTVDIVWDGVASTRANPGWTLVDSSSSRFVVTGPASVAWFDGQWHELATSLDANWISVTEDNFVFGRTDTACALSRVDLATGTVTALPVAPAPLCIQGVALGATALYVHQFAQGIRKWNGSTWVDVTAITSHALRRVDDRRIASLDSVAQTTRFIDTSVDPETIGPAQLGSTALVGVAFGIDGDVLRMVHEDEPAFTWVTDNAQFTLAELAVAGQTQVARSADGRILTFGAGVMGMRPLTSAIPLPSNTELGDVHHAADGLVACGSRVYVAGLGGFTQRPFDTDAHGPCQEVTGNALGVHFVRAAQFVFMYNAGNNTYGQVHGTAVTSIAGDFTLMRSAAPDVDAVLSITNGSSGTLTVEPLPTGCEIVRLAMSPDRRFFGAGNCNNTLAVFEYTTAWTTVATSTLPATTTAALQLDVGTDGTVVVLLGTTAYRLDGTTLTEIGTGLRVDVVTADDIFIEQGDETMLHITSAQSQELRLPSGPFVATPTHLYSWDRLSRRIYGVARMPSHPAGP